MQIIEALNWRYDTKRMNGNKIPTEKLDCILEAIRLAPSAMGLQPYTIIVIENIELMKKIQPIANLQQEITEASVLLVFASWNKITPERINEHLKRISLVRDMNENSLKLTREKMEMLLNNTVEENFIWSAKQAYLALGIGMTAAALEKVDTTPIDHFNNADLDEVLQLKERGLRSILLLSLGYRDTAKDLTIANKKVRREREKLFITLQSTIGFNATNINNKGSITL
ncbi:MAG: nitroreductase family protein [Bacteroidia bacterium]|nr:nitroreductase family protein [Bacteroidia bacterium]